MAAARRVVECSTAEGGTRHPRNLCSVSRSAVIHAAPRLRLPGTAFRSDFGFGLPCWYSPLTPNQNNYRLNNLLLQPTSPHPPSQLPSGLTAAHTGGPARHHPNIATTRNQDTSEQLIAPRQTQSSQTHQTHTRPPSPLQLPRKPSYRTPHLPTHHRTTITSSPTCSHPDHPPGNPATALCPTTSPSTRTSHTIPADTLLHRAHHSSGPANPT